MDAATPLMSYTDELRKAMRMLADHPKVIFVGQAVSYPGTFMNQTLVDVPTKQKVEMPVAEDMQMGLCIGMSLDGWIPVCIYPRINFLLLAMNQLVLHLDKLPLFSGYRPKVIIRTAIGHDQPLDPGAQHIGDYGDAVASMLTTVKPRRIAQASEVMDTYRQALADDGSSLVIEQMDQYG